MREISLWRNNKIKWRFSLFFVIKGRWLSDFSKIHFSQRRVIWINNDITGGKLIPWVIPKARLDWMLLSVLWIMYVSIRKFLVMACMYFLFHNHLSLCYSRTTFVILRSISLTLRNTRTYLYFSVRIIFHCKNTVSIYGDILKLKKN